MSSKPSGSTKDTSKKNPHRETMVTRHKSAQSKRQLREMDRSMKKITQLLKSPERSPKMAEKQSKSVVSPLKSKSIVKTYSASSKCASSSPENTQKASAHSSKITVTKTTSPSSKSKKTEAKNLPKSPKKLAEKTKLLPKIVKKKKVVTEIQEFHPNKMKRKTKTPKITLKPKHELTTVHSLNKRKRTTPQKESKSPVPCERSKIIHKDNSEPKPKKQKIQSEVEAMEDEFVLKDDTDLTDEDLMEILTCPSPVWWEDPPDVTYCEDPIFKSPLNNWRRRKEKSAKAIETKQEDKIIAELKDKVASKVGNVETISEVAKKSPIKTEDKFFNKRSTLESLLSNLKTKKEVSLKNENVKILKEISPLRKVRKPPKPNKAGQDNSSPKSETESSAKSKGHTISESSDLSDIRDDEMLKDLENLDIPMEKAGAKIKPSSVNTLTEVIVLDDDLPEISSGNRCEPSTSRSSDSATIDTQVNPASVIEDNLEVSMVEGSDAIILPRPKKLNQKGKLGMRKVHILPQKTLLWSSKIDDEKTINLVNDTVLKLRKESIVKPIQHQIDVPKDLPPLKKFSKVSDTKIASLCLSKNDSCDSDDVTDSSSIVSNPEMDTISDTNVKFIMDDEIVDENQVNLNESVINIEEGGFAQHKNTGEADLNLKRDGTGDINDKSDNKMQFFLRNSIKNNKADEKKLKTNTSDSHNDVAISTKATKNKKSNDTELNIISTVQNSEQDRILVYKIIESTADDPNNVEITDISDCNRNLDEAESYKNADSDISEIDTMEKQSKNSNPQIINFNFLTGSTNGSVKKKKNHAPESNNKKFSVTKSEISKTYKAMTVKFFEKENMVKAESVKKPVILIKKKNEKSSQCENLSGLCTCPDCTSNTVFGCPKFGT